MPGPGQTGTTDEDAVDQPATMPATHLQNAGAPTPSTQEGPGSGATGNTELQFHDISTPEGPDEPHGQPGPASILPMAAGAALALGPTPAAVVPPRPDGPHMSWVPEKHHELRAFLDPPPRNY